MAAPDTEIALAGIPSTTASTVDSVLLAQAAGLVQVYICRGMRKSTWGGREQVIVAWGRILKGSWRWRRGEKGETWTDTAIVVAGSSGTVIVSV